MQKIVPNLWFEDQAEEAANFYISVFKDGRITNISRYGEAAAAVAGRPKGSVLTVDFEIHGQRFTALNGGPQFRFSEAISLLVRCDSQREVDELWETLTAGGGEESRCGWLKDKYGLSWQIVPAEFEQMLAEADAEATERMMQSMLQMDKLDIEAIRRARDNRSS